MINVNVRIISATNKSISNLVEKGEFRRDLMYRLDVLRLFIPPLRSRENDVEILFNHLLQILASENHISMPMLEPDAFELLHLYPFMGNIRELRNIAERIVVLKKSDFVSRQDLQEALYPNDLEPEDTAHVYKEELCLEAISEPERLKIALEKCGGSRIKAAKLLGMDRSTLWRKLRKDRKSVV